MARRRVLQPSTTAAPAVLAAPVAVVAVASLLLIAFASRFSDFVTDDAFITFRYAHNLLTGHGMVFNPGERVEGYTNFLWVLCSSVALFVGIDPETAARALLLGSPCSLPSCASARDLRHPWWPSPLDRCCWRFTRPCRSGPWAVSKSLCSSVSCCGASA